MHLPGPGAARKWHLKGASAFATQTIGKAELACALCHKAFGRLSQKTLTRAVHQLKLLLTVECEDRDFYLGHYGPEQCSGFQSAKPLFAQNLPKEIHLEHCFSQSIVASSASRANRKIAFSQCRKQIRESL